MELWDYSAELLYIKQDNILLKNLLPHPMVSRGQRKSFFSLAQMGYKIFAQKGYKLSLLCSFFFALLSSHSLKCLSPNKLSDVSLTFTVVGTLCKHWQITNLRAIVNGSLLLVLYRILTRTRPPFHWGDVWYCDTYKNQATISLRRCVVLYMILTRTRPPFNWGDVWYCDTYKNQATISLRRCVVLYMILTRTRPPFHWGDVWYCDTYKNQATISLRRCVILWYLQEPGHHFIEEMCGVLSMNSSVLLS